MAGTGIYGELLKAQLENLSSDPGSTSVGRLYWNTTTQSARIYTSSGWDDFGGGGSGASGRNYLSDWFDCDRDVGSVTNSITATGNITISTLLWQASDTAEKLTVARTSSSPLRQTYSLLLDNIGAGAAFVQTPCFLLDAADLGKPVTVSFDVANVVTSDDYQVYAVRYNSGGTYQEQIPIAGTASATSPYSARIPTGTTKFQGFFIAGSTSTDYYVIRFYRNSASDTTDIKVDSLYVGPEKVVQGAAVTDWVAFTPSWSNSTNMSVNTAWRRRTGDSMQVMGYAVWNGAGGGTSLALTIPNSNLIDTTKVSGVASTDSMVGNAQFFDVGTAIYQMIVSVASSTTVVFMFSSANQVFDGSQAGNTDRLYYNFTVPISGWSSNVTMADRAVEEYAYNTGAVNAADNTTDFAYGASGTPILGHTTTSGTTWWNYHVKFQTTRLPSDRVIVEVKESASAPWVDAATRYPAAEQSTSKYGIFLRESSVDNAVCVSFGKRGAAPSNASLGGTGTAWNTSGYWRVRKVSGGAAVGYPIGARNIVGDTTGTAVPSGIVGEKFVSVGVATLAAGSIGNDSYTDTDMSISLPKGCWLVGYSICMSVSVGDASAVMNLSTDGNIAGSTGFIGIVYPTALGFTTVARSVPIVTTTDQTLKVRVRKTAGGNAALQGESITGNLTNPDNENSLWAVRIA